MTSRASRIRIALLGLWVGVAALFSFVVAPGAFAVLPSPQLAGNIVSRVLSGVEIIGILVGLALIGVSLFVRSRETRRPVFELVVVVLLTLAMTISHFVVSARLHALRDQFGEHLSDLPSEDTTRVTFDLLHRCSVGLLSFSLFAAIVLLAVLIWRDSSSRQPHASV